MFSRSIRKAVRPYLHTSEALLAALLAQNAGANVAAMVYALRGETATVRAFDRADQAHADVDGIDVAPDELAKSVTLRARGAAIRIEIARGQRAEDLPRVLQHARDAAHALDREGA